MGIKEFEELLNILCSRLTTEANANIFSSSKVFENRVRDVLQDLCSVFNILIDYNPHPYIFPDIAAGPFGVEVKFTTQDTWRSVANSIFETFRNKDVDHIYVVYGKMGGEPSVKWQLYQNCVIHVRTSHVPRFELEIGASVSLFDQLNIRYNDFSMLPLEKKMHFIRNYARSRLKEGERLWWLEEKDEPEHSLPIQVRLYIELSPFEKRRLRAEAALLCPQILSGSRVKNKYNDAALFLLTYHGVLASQARDLFSAGSVAMRSDSTRGGLYIQRALVDIENEMIEAANRMEMALFIEYWGESVNAENRISHWLKLADKFAKGWIPSSILFKK